MTSRSTQSWTAIFAATALAIGSFAGAAEAADPYFKGKTVNLIVGFEAGGGVDLTARMFARNLGRHVAGNPEFVVQNMPGASSMKAHNYIFEVAKPDGLNLLYSPWFPVSQILGAEGVRFRYQDFALVGAFRTSGFFVYARTDIVPGGLTRSADIVKAQNLKFAGQNPFNTFDLLGRLSIELFDVRYGYVTGYRGSAGIRTAIMKNESNIGVDSVTGLRSVMEDTMMKPGIAKVLWGFPTEDSAGKPIRNPNLPEAPSVLEVYRDAFGKNPSGIAWEVLDLNVKFYSNIAQLVAAPPGLPDAPLADLRRGLYATMADKGFREEYVKRFGYEAIPTPVETAQKTIQSLKSIEPRLVARLQAHVKAGAKVQQ